MKKRKDGRYQKQIFVGYSPDGKRKFKTFYGYTLKEVEAQVVDFQSKLNMGIAILDDSVTVEEWANTWFEMHKNNVKPATANGYSNIINNYIISYWGKFYLKDLKNYHIQKVLNDICAEGKSGTARYIKQILVQILNKAIENDLIYKNVAKGVTVAHVPKKRRALTLEEQQLFETADLNVTEKAFAFILLYAGLRQGEALALLKSDINFDNQTISVSKTLIYNSNPPYIQNAPKSQAGIRTITIPAKILPIIKKQVNLSNSIYLFCDESGSLYNISLVQKLWKNIMRKVNDNAGGCNLYTASKKKTKVIAIDTKISPHWLRHTYATKLYYAGIDVKTAQYFLGHSDISMTMNVYTHLDADNLKNTSAKINEL